MGLGLFDPRIEMRGYPELVDNRVQINLLIHQWDNTAHTYHLLSVLTDDRIQTQAGGAC